MATTNEHTTTTTFSQDDRLEKLPPLNEQYAIDDLLTEHFGFAPKVFTGHIFNIINEAIYDTVSEVEKAVIESYFPGSAVNGTEGLPSSTSTGYPSKDDIAKSLNQLETLLCSSIDNQFDLLEIWLHRNVFNFPNLREELMKHLRFKHMNLWDQFYQLAQPTTSSDPQASADQIVSPDWEKLKLEEEERWAKLEKFKSDYNQSKDDYHSLLAVSNVLDRKLAGLKAVSSQLTQISSEARTIYDPETNKPVDLIGQSTMILGDYQRLLKLDKVRETRERATNFAKSAPQHASHPMTAEEMIEDEQDPSCCAASATPFQTHARAINLLSKAKVDDFLAELADKGALDVDRDEGLVEVHNQLLGKGKTPAANTPLHQDRI
ncbi:hypothetical protein PGT21_023680 [Puccinia graminis f. sp. tritici]|uniref:Uncharacterized protein n=1 Tax=Puccinia graminis f. sp. tritici TaxID=56615 RepID=A0A5B0NF05_PUCGR|nr:hypothetical protein PGT21_023680 [Puccinia graminis f. sp. tritici]